METGPRPVMTDYRKRLKYYRKLLKFEAIVQSRLRSVKCPVNRELSPGRKGKHRLSLRFPSRIPLLR